jgi:hypothetical protein
VPPLAAVSYIETGGQHSHRTYCPERGASPAIRFAAGNLATIAAISIRARRGRAPTRASTAASAF